MNFGVIAVHVRRLGAQQRQLLRWGEIGEWCEELRGCFYRYGSGHAMRFWEATVKFGEFYQWRK